MIRAQPMTFEGPCNGCGKKPKGQRAAVAFVSDNIGDPRADAVDEGDWVCVACARRLSKSLAKAATEAVKNVKRGLEFVHGKWRKPPSKTSRAASS